RRTARYYTAWGLLLTACLLLLLWVGREFYGRHQAQRLQDRLLEATTEKVPGIVDDMKAYRRWLDPSLPEAYALEEAKGDDGDKRRQLHASLALLPVDPGQVDYLFQRLLTANPQELLVIRETLQPHADDVSARLWDVMQERTRPPGERLRAACAL